MSLLLLFGGGVQQVGFPDQIFLNRVKFRSSTSGLSDFVVASAITGYMTPETAGIESDDEELVSYTAESDDLSQWEVGSGLINGATMTVARTTIRASSSGDAGSGFNKVNFSAAPIVWFDFHAEDIGLYVYSTVSGDHMAVSFGATDSGGSGYRVLRVRNDLGEDE